MRMQVTLRFPPILKLKVKTWPRVRGVVSLGCPVSSTTAPFVGIGRPVNNRDYECESGFHGKEDQVWESVNLRNVVESLVDAITKSIGKRVRNALEIIKCVDKIVRNGRVKSQPMSHDDYPPVARLVRVKSQAPLRDRQNHRDAP